MSVGFRSVVSRVVPAVHEKWAYRHCPSIPSLYDKYRDFTMIPREKYLANLVLAHEHRGVPGVVVECGVWRGGMIAGMAEVLGANREYLLFDSFDGLPAPTPEDGEFAIAWSQRGDSPFYSDNCRADEAPARQAMRQAGIDKPTLIKGDFENTVPRVQLPGPISVLRLDGDWYRSTDVCLRELFPHVADGGVVILDDYGFWKGTTQAVHEFLVRMKGRVHLRQKHDLVFYLVKSEADPAEASDKRQRDSVR